MSENTKSTVPYVQEQEFDALLADNSLVVVDFTASWCGPCRKISPLMDQLMQDFPNEVTVVKIDIDQCKVTAKQYSIKSIPAVLIFKEGVVVETHVGFKPYETFSEAVRQHL